MVRIKLGWRAATTDLHVFDRVTVYRYLDLPFPPFKGLRLANVLPNQSQPLEVVSALSGFVWDVQQGCFLCELEGEDFNDVSLTELLEQLGPEWHAARHWPEDRESAAA